MNILVTLAVGPRRTRWFPPPVCGRLERCGNVTWQTSTDPLAPAGLRAALCAIDVVVTDWQTPRLDAAVLAGAERLKLIVHLGATVAPYVSADLFDRGIRVCSARHIFAPFVAEAILALMLTAQRDLARVDRAMHRGDTWPRDPARPRTLMGRSIGFVGLGAVGLALLPLLAPFQVEVCVADPYAAADALAPFPFARFAPLDAVLAAAEILSLHAALTPGTRGLLDAARLRRLRDDALVVNAARGSLIDEAALAAELTTGRLRAALDVFAAEPLPAGSPLRGLANVVLSPHQAGLPAHPHLAAAMIEEIERFQAGGPLRHEISAAEAVRMSEHR